MEIWLSRKNTIHFYDFPSAKNTYKDWTITFLLYVKHLNVTTAVATKTKKSEANFMLFTHHKKNRSNIFFFSLSRCHSLNRCLHLYPVIIFYSYSIQCNPNPPLTNKINSISTKNS